MPSVQGLGHTFDRAAALYDKIRPGYPPELYRAILDYKPLDRGSRLLEIGPGTGQATAPFLALECGVTAVEPGEQLAALCREKFRDRPHFSLITGKFEETPLPEGQFDLVYAATAFHWVPEEVGYPKVFRLLKPGGVFARFHNRPYLEKPQKSLEEAFSRLYGRYMNDPSIPAPFAEETAAKIAQTALQYGFVDCCHRLFYRERRLSAAEYVALSGTYSDHLALPEGERAAFFAGIEQAIDDHGGFVTIRDTIDLELARKPF